MCIELILELVGGWAGILFFLFFVISFQHVKKLLTVACPFNSTPKVLVFVEKLKITNDSNKSPQNSSSHILPSYCYQLVKSEATQTRGIMHNFLHV